MAASLEPGASVSRVAREAGIHPGQLYGWRRQLGRPAQVSFAPVRIAPEGAPAGLAGAAMIEIEFASGTRMRIKGADGPHRYAPWDELAGAAGAGSPQA